MALYRIEVFLDENYVKTMYRDGNSQEDVETDIMDRLEITLDVEEID